MTVEMITAFVTVLVLAVVVAVRSLSAGKIEIKLNDAIIAAIAATLTLLVSGRVSKVVLGTEGVTLETAKQAILTASAQSITQQVATLPVAPVEVAQKGGPSELQTLVNRQVQALEFVIGAGGYDAGVIQQYLETLTKYPFFRFVAFLNSDLTLFGLLDGNKLLAQLRSGSPETFGSFATLVNSRDANARSQIARIPGFVPASAGVTRQTDKRDALERLEKLGSDWLPVLKDDKLDGILERSRLTASLILDVTNQLRASAGAQQ